MDARELLRELAAIEDQLARVDAAESKLLLQKDRIESALERLTQPPPSDPDDPPTRPDDDDDVDPVPPPAGAWVQPGEVGAAVTSSPIFKEFGHDVTQYTNGSNLHFIAGSKTNSITNTLYSGTKGAPLFWNNIEVSSQLTSKVKWGMIAFDIEDWRLANCTFRDIPVEHGLYWTTVGGFELDGCLFKNIGSQGVQVVFPVGKRAFQTGLGDQVAARLAQNVDQWQIVRNCAFDQVGNPTYGARPSYAISMFSGNANPVLVTGCFLRTSSPFDNNGPRDCTGAIMAHNRSHAEISDCYIEYLNGDRSVIQLWRNHETVIRGCQVKSAKPVDIRGKPGDKVVIEGNVGSTCQVIVSTNDTLNDNPPVDFNLDWDASKVVYQGPLSDDFEVTL